MLELLTKLLYFYLPFQIALNPIKGVDLASIRIIIPLIFIAWFINSLKNKKIIIPNSMTFLSISSFLFLSTFSLFFAANTSWGLRKLLFLFSIFPVFFIIYSNFSFNAEKKISLINYYLWGAFLSSLIGIGQFFSQFIIPLPKLYHFWGKLVVPFLGNSLSESVSEYPSWLVNIGGKTILRATSFFPDPHMFSFYLNIASLLSLGLYFHYRNNSKKSLYLLIFISTAFCGMLTFSRGGYLAFISGMIFFGYFTLKDRLSLKIKKGSWLIILISIFIFSISTLIFPNKISARLLSSFNLSEGSNTERLVNWKQSIKVIKEKPFFGVGIGNYSRTIKPSADYREPIYSHNAFLDITAETGIINLFFWIAIFILTITNFLKIFKKYSSYLHLGLASSLAYFTIHSIFETALYSVHILPIIILILALNQNQTNEKNI